MLVLLKIIAIMASVSVLVVAAYLWVVFSIVPDPDLRMRLKIGAAVAFAMALLALIAMSTSAGAQDHHSNPWLLSWIPATCCVTNDCCWEIQESELRALPDDHWEVKSTGQVRKRTAWSPDGRFYRCACDYDNVDKNWVRHQGANTRCLFVPMRSAKFSLRHF